MKKAGKRLVGAFKKGSSSSHHHDDSSTYPSTELMPSPRREVPQDEHMEEGSHDDTTRLLVDNDLGLVGDWETQALQPSQGSGGCSHMSICPELAAKDRFGC